MAINLTDRKRYVIHNVRGLLLIMTERKLSVTGCILVWHRFNILYYNVLSISLSILPSNLISLDYYFLFFSLDKLSVITSSIKRTS